MQGTLKRLSKRRGVCVCVRERAGVWPRAWAALEGSVSREQRLGPHLGSDLSP